MDLYHIQSNTSRLQTQQEDLRLPWRLLEFGDCFMPSLQICWAVQPVPYKILSIQYYLNEVKETRELRKDDSPETGILVFQPACEYSGILVRITRKNYRRVRSYVDSESMHLAWSSSWNRSAEVRRQVMTVELPNPSLHLRPWRPVQCQRSLLWSFFFLQFQGGHFPRFSLSYIAHMTGKVSKDVLPRVHDGR